MNEAANQSIKFSDATIGVKVKLGLISVLAIIAGYIILAGMNMGFVIYWFVVTIQHLFGIIVIFYKLYHVTC